VTARWLDHSPPDYREAAERNLADVRRADVLLLVGHAGRNGGLMVELGVALERGMRVIHVAAERGDCVFTHTPEVTYVRSITEALELLSRKLVAA
jgi:hypothetical protein